MLNLSCMRPHGSAEELERRRRRAIALLETGHRQAEVAGRVDAHPASVKRWREAYQENSEGGLAPKPMPGRPSKLTVRQQRLLVARWLRGAQANGFSTGSSISGAISRDIVSPTTVDVFERARTEADALARCQSLIRCFVHSSQLTIRPKLQYASLMIQDSITATTARNCGCREYYSFHRGLGTRIRFQKSNAISFMQDYQTWQEVYQAIVHCIKWPEETVMFSWSRSKLAKLQLKVVRAHRYRIQLRTFDRVEFLESAIHNLESVHVRVLVGGPLRSLISIHLFRGVTSQLCLDR